MFVINMLHLTPTSIAIPGACLEQDMKPLTDLFPDLQVKYSAWWIWRIDYYSLIDLTDLKALYYLNK